MFSFFWILEEDLVVWIFVIRLKSAWKGIPSCWCLCVSPKQYKSSQALPSDEDFLFGLQLIGKLWDIPEEGNPFSKPDYWHGTKPGAKFCISIQ